MDIICLTLSLLMALTGLSAAWGVAVSTAAELNAALSNQQVDTILLLNNIAISATKQALPLTVLRAATPPDIHINRSVRITSPWNGPHHSLDCSLVQYRYLLGSNIILNLQHISIRNCNGIEELMLFAKDEDTTVILDDVIQDQGSYCAPPDLASDYYTEQPRPAGVPGAGPATEQQLSIPAAAGTNWCEVEPEIIQPRFNPPVTDLCPFQPLLLQDVVLHEEKRPGEYGSWNLVYRHVLQCGTAFQKSSDLTDRN